MATRSMWMGAVLGSGLIAALVAGAACGSDTVDVAPAGTSAAGANGPSSGGSGGAGPGGAGGAGTAGMGGMFIPPPPTEEAPCANQLYQCGDLDDNDMDGLIDYQDPDCLGPCDNTEDSLYPNLPGAPGAPCQLDCFWDTGNGPGNDGCYWDHRCDPLEVAPNFPPEGPGCAYDPNTTAGPYTCTEALAMQSSMCTSVCAPLTPNGCDCFGCCELPAESGLYVWLGSEDGSDNGTCTMANINDPLLCKPCTPVPGCLNPCGHCELCVGKYVLPLDCSDPECGQNVQVCGTPGDMPCPSGFYCITGCCQPIPQ